MGILPQSSEIKDTTINTYKDNLIGKRTFKFNFEKNEFVTDVMGRSVITNNPEEVLEQVVNKVLHDRRYKNIIYPDSYGNEIDTVLEQDDPFEVVECELQRVYSEALIYHSLIENIAHFSASYEGDKIICEFIVIGIDGTQIKKVEELVYGNK